MALAPGQAPPIDFPPPPPDILPSSPPSPPDFEPPIVPPPPPDAIPPPISAPPLPPDVVTPPTSQPPPPDVVLPPTSPPPPSDLVPPPVSSPPPPDIVPPPVSLPPPPDVVPPPVSQPPPPDVVPPPPDVVTPPVSPPTPPDVVPPPPDVVTPPVSPPPPPDVVPPPVSQPPPPDIVPPPVSQPSPPDVVPPTVSQPPPPLPNVVPPPVSQPPPPDVVPPPVLQPPPPDTVPPPVSQPPPRPPDIVPPPVSQPPPPPPDVLPPPISQPPPPDVLPPPISQPPPPDDVPPPVSSPPPPPDVLPPTVSPPPPPNALPPTESPPSPPSLSPPLVNSPPAIPSPSTSQSPPSHNPKSPSSPSLVPPPPKSSTSTIVVVGAALGGVALLLAVLGLFWFLHVRQKKRRDPHEIDSHYRPGDGHNGTSGQSGYPPSGQQFSTSNVSSSQLAAQPSMSNSAGFSSGQPHESPTNGTGRIWSDNSETVNSFLSSGQGMVLGSGTISFTYDELKIATNGFSSVNLLGQGGFGNVHRGMLRNGKIVAVKSLKADSGQGEREFQAEVETISRVHHKHLVTLVGYCITDSQKLLVYEYVENKTMEFHVHVKGEPVMDWPTRLKIAIGAAKGLAYLHEDCHPKIIHRDIKAANILLDHSFEAKVADFGLAKFYSDAYTHISTRVMGTFGYLAPEYASSGQLSDKSDVFSFGVLLLELVTGRRPVDFTSRAQMEDSLVDWARPLLAKALQDGNFDAIVDPRLENNYNHMEMGSMITCAASCVRHSAKRRPRLSQVVRALEGDLELSDLNAGVKPGFSSLYSSADLYEPPNTDNMLRFRRTAYGHGDEESSEFSVTRNEFSGGR
ncbi:hypothetical protein vseg_016374 [Gypsophila vaccaria]